jgi:hypothetical protein
MDDNYGIDFEDLQNILTSTKSISSVSKDLVYFTKMNENLSRILLKLSKYYISLNNLLYDKTHIVRILECITRVVNKGYIEIDMISGITKQSAYMIIGNMYNFGNTEDIIDKCLIETNICFRLLFYLNRQLDQSNQELINLTQKIENCVEIILNTYITLNPKLDRFIKKYSLKYNDY